MYAITAHSLKIQKQFEIECVGKENVRGKESVLDFNLADQWWKRDGSRFFMQNY